MLRRSPNLAACLSTLVFLGSCSSGTEPWPFTNPSPAALAGRYAIADAVSLPNGVTIIADTLILGVDRSLARRQFARGPGPIGDMMSSGIGTYTVSGHTIVLTFNCLNGVCYGTQILNAYARGLGGMVMEVILNEGGRTTVFERAKE